MSPLCQHCIALNSTLLYILTTSMCHEEWEKLIRIHKVFSWPEIKLASGKKGSHSLTRQPKRFPTNWVGFRGFPHQGCHYNWLANYHMANYNLTQETSYKCHCLSNIRKKNHFYFTLYCLLSMRIHENFPLSAQHSVGLSAIMMLALIIILDMHLFTSCKWVF